MSLKRVIVFCILGAFFMISLEGCFLKKNKCDSCTGILKYKKKKKIRKSSKGSI